MKSGNLLDLIGPEEIRASWIEAMRSGLWNQCVGRLRDEESYDSLGLLCRVMVDLGIENMSPEEWDRERPPYRTCKAAGLKSKKCEDGMAIGGEVEVIERLNDRGMSFPMIADMLEQRNRRLDVYQLGE